MRLKGTFLTSIVAAALAMSLGSVPVHATDGKPDGGPSGVDGRAAADVAAGTTAPTVSPDVALASSTIQARIVDHVRVNGTKYSFGSYADATVDKVVVDTDAPADVVSALVGSYGDLVVVRQRSISDSFHRRDDVAPYWGGAGITPTPGVGHCSSGYSVQNSAATRFMVTAGHCFANGQTAYTETAPGRIVGTVSGNGLPTHDMELIGGQSYGAYIYTGGVADTVASHVASAGDPVVGFANYCHSGRTTGTHCGHLVDSVTATVCTSSGCKSPVSHFCGGVQPAGGDSGGPFFVDSVAPAPDKHIRGHIIAGDGTCSYAELWSRVAARYGVTIVT